MSLYQRTLPVYVIKNAGWDSLFGAKLASFVLISKAVEGFLTKYQSPAPLAPFLFQDPMDLVKGLLQRCVKSSVSRLLIHVPS
jgi:hypothetical protein